MINNFLIISCIGNDDKLGLRINKEFFVHNMNKKNLNDNLVSEILIFASKHEVKFDENFTIIVNQGPGSFSSIRISLSIAKGLEISKKIKLYGFKNTDLKVFDQENIEEMLRQNLIEKNLIKPIYLS
tara:strand:+ start:195 stop:575 length:381 start_codon:yes stop_codon:yes gene_type:complete